MPTLKRNKKRRTYLPPMITIKKELIQDLYILYMKHVGQYYGKAKLSIDGYEIIVKTEYFDLIDDAVIAIKDKVSEAVTKFDLPIK